MKLLSPASQQIIFRKSTTEIQEVTVGEKHQHRRKRGGSQQGFQVVGTETLVK